MMHIDARIDSQIEKAAPFAQPILHRLREIMHSASPDIEEAIKWGMPAFLYRGKILANMAAFKSHAVFGIWRGPEADKESGRAAEAMGSLGRLTSLNDLPPTETLLRMIRDAMAAIDAGAPRRAASKARPELAVPDDLGAAIRANAAAHKVFESFAPSHRRDYVEWIISAKRDDTRARRIEQAVAWLSEGKKRHWKYENC
jgi:uncharacterized protein YdeI (YjbR/CyaY-like superfamily)